MKRLLVVCVALGLSTFQMGCALAARLERLEFDTSSGAHVFSVEIADTDATREIGLMNRRFMPADHAMLFEFPREESVSFWMKNTYIPLDMVFVRADGTVTRIAANAEPLSETTIPSGGPCLGVIELNGGGAAAIGLAPGDIVRHPFFKR